MRLADRIILLQKQVSVARKALEEIKNRSGHDSWGIADQALEDIEHIRFVKGGQ